MAAGNFIQRYNQQIDSAMMFADGRNNRELVKPIDATLAVGREQLVNFVPVLKDGRCIAVEAIWLKSCNEDVVDCEAGGTLSDCDLDGIEAESVKKTYQPNVCLRKSIKVNMDDCAGFKSTEDKLAFMKAKAKAVIEYNYNLKLIASLVANSQANAFPEGGTVAGTKVTFPAASWDAQLLSKFHISAQKNQVYNAYLVNGSNFYEAKWLYEYKEKSGSADVYTSILDRGPWNMYWDIINMDTTIGANASFLIDRSSIAMFGQNEYIASATSPINLKADLYVYNEPSRIMYSDGGVRNEDGSGSGGMSPMINLIDPNLRDAGTNLIPMMFDVAEQDTCITVGTKRYRAKTIEFCLRGGIVTGPEDCGGGSGILHFEQS